MSNFKEWENNFLTSFNDSNEFQKKSQDCINFIEQIKRMNQLDSPHTNETNQFLSNTLSLSIEKILNFQIESSEDTMLTFISTFLQSFLSLIPWSFINNQFDLFDLLIKY